MFLIVAGKKKKEQHDAQAGLGLNPAYAGAYGVAPPVSMLSFLGPLLSSFEMWFHVLVIFLNPLCSICFHIGVSILYIL